MLLELPGQAETYIDYYTSFQYRRTMKHNNIDGPNNGAQYPGNLSNDTWRKFTINWNATTSTLTYQLEGLSSVSIPINVQDIFGADQVYWGLLVQQDLDIRTIVLHLKKCQG
ncbi:hypothetical protein KEH51_21930 [[Brevibacterium] frigoritolerans]|uniref:Uncharacterized protein n=1 Tax=Peribacillus frigoritolerans TaxID=450367 RepID=A0A941JBF1_9BACI|nr:hypothetical protein [Peribacillus frigoritolerans]